MSEIEKLKAQNAELSDRIAKLEEAAKPPKPVEWTWQKPDYTANARMPDSVLREMLAAVPESVMRELRSDAGKPNPITQASSSPLSTTPSAQPQPQRRGSGWREEAPLGPPPGIDHCDRMMDEQDKIDRVELALRLAKASLNKSEE